MHRGSVSHRAWASVLAGCLAACTVPIAPTSTASTGDLTDRVDALVAPFVAEHEFSGAIVMARGDQIVYARGFGMANHAVGVAFTPHTPVDGGSLAKTFTAAGILWLAHDGNIELGAAVQEYVPEYPHPQTTVRQLLSHSNGLPLDYELFDDYFKPDEVRTTSGMLRIVTRQAVQPSFAPGTQYEYSNLGFDTAALVIERVTGQSYEDFVKERFFSRLGLQSSFARPARLADWEGVRTVGYRWREGTWQPHDALDGEGFLGGSNFYFSAADLVRWGSANASGSALPEPVFEAGQQQLIVGGLPLQVTGLSWYCDDRKIRCNYSGHHVGFHSFLFWDRERNETLAFVSNSTLPAWKIAILQRELVNALASHPPDVDTSVAFVDIPKIDPAEVAGTYLAPAIPAVTITAGEGGGFKIRWGEGLEYDAYPADFQVLYVPGLDFYLAFSGDKGARALHVKAQELNTIMRPVGLASGDGE